MSSYISLIGWWCVEHVLAADSLDPADAISDKTPAMSIASDCLFGPAMPPASASLGTATRSHCDTIVVRST